MKKLALLLLLGLLLLPTALAQCLGDDDQLIFRISEPTNAHAELWNGAGLYPERICYEDVFGVPYPGPVFHPACDATNAILWASDTTNAHVEVDFAGPPQNYSDPICYGDILRLNCDYVLDPNPCTIFDPAAECIATISDTMNAHVSICDDPGSFPLKVCCASAVVSVPTCSVDLVVPNPVDLGVGDDAVVTVSYSNFSALPVEEFWRCGTGSGATAANFVCVGLPDGTCTYDCEDYLNPGVYGDVFVQVTEGAVGPSVDCGAIPVTVLAAGNIPPVADAGPDQSTPSGVSVSLSGLCDDSDGAIADCDWGPAPVGCVYDFAEVKAGLGTASASSSVDVTCVGAPADVFTFTVTATDDDAATDSDDLTVTIALVANVAPNADAGPDQVTTSGVSVSLSGTCDDTDGTINDCDWGAAPVGCVYDFAEVKAGLGTPNAASDVDVTCVGAPADVFSFTLTATDDDLDTGNDSMTVTIALLPPNIPPVANAGPDSLAVSGASVSLSGSCDDTDGTIASCDWGAAPLGCAYDFPQVQAGLGTPNATSNVDVTCVGAPADVFTFTLTAIDDDLDTGTDDMTITIAALVGQPFLQITRFDAEPLFFPAPNPAAPPNRFSDIIVTVLNSGDAENVRIELQVLDPITNVLILDPPAVGCGVVASGAECTRIRDIAVDNFPGLDISSLPPGAYKLQASALDEIGAVHDKEVIFFTVARPIPLPEFGLLLLPLIAFSVLVVIFLSKRKS